MPMSDVSRYLPLSQRSRHDESDVSGDWSQRLSVVLGSLTVLLDDLTPDEQTLVRDTVGRLVWRLRANRRARLGAKLRRREPLSMSDDQSAVLRSIAAGSGRRRPVADLASAVLATLEVASATQRAVELDAVSLGAVAVARALSAPLPVRAVLGTTTLVAADGEWSVGRGTQRRANGADIVLFLYGRTGLPPALG